MSKNDTQNQFNQFQNLFGQNQFAQIDFSKAAEIVKNSFEASAQVQQSLLEKTQKIAQAQVEFFQAQAEKTTQAASESISAKNPEENLEKSQKFAQAQLDASIKNAQEFAKSSSEVAAEGFENLNKQAVESLNKLSELAAAK